MIGQLSSVVLDCPVPPWRAADADDRSLSSWIRLAVEHELRRPA